jgi:hypothetical protein
MFIRNLAAFTDALGVENAPTIFYLSQLPWVSDDDRNDFIETLTGVSIQDRNTYGP